MKVAIAGGTGFLGHHLSDRLADDGADVVVLTRRRVAASPASRCRFVTWLPESADQGELIREVASADVVVNLAGESIAGARWSPAHKARIRDSRIVVTRRLVDAMRRPSSAQVLVNGSAVGYYGPRGPEEIREDAPPGSDFLAGVCVEWEAEASRAAASGARVVLIRTGLVLDRDGGALKQMLPPFQLGVGGRLGSGEQYWPWIHRADWIELVCWAIRNASVAGAVNATAPNPVTNTEFTRILGRVLHRPTLIPASSFALRLLLGEMADALLLSGQRAVPAVADRLGFAFQYVRLGDALHAIFA